MNLENANYKAMLERISTLERERDEARAAFCKLREEVKECLSLETEGEFVSEDDAWWHDQLSEFLNSNPDKPEWRKDGE